MSRLFLVIKVKDQRGILIQCLLLTEFNLSIGIQLENPLQSENAKKSNFKMFNYVRQEVQYDMSYESYVNQLNIFDLTYDFITITTVFYLHLPLSKFNITLQKPCQISKSTFEVYTSHKMSPHQLILNIRTSFY